MEGIEENLALVPAHYPGWLVRVYYDLAAGDPTLDRLCRLACANPALDLCYVRALPSSGDISRIFAMNWRFFPTLDPQVNKSNSQCKPFIRNLKVDAFVSRDLDSRINSREAAAVSAWSSGSHHFHFMRDHPAHG